VSGWGAYFPVDTTDSDDVRPILTPPLNIVYNETIDDNLIAGFSPLYVFFSFLFSLELNSTITINIPKLTHFQIISLQIIYIYIFPIE